MDVSVFGEIKDMTDEKLTEIGLKYAYKYYPARDEFKRDPTEVSELLDFAYGKVFDLIEILTKDQSQVQKIRAYRQEIEALNKYVDYDLAEVYADLDHVKDILDGGD